ncbi:hypothetical protein [Falsibacillus pallidus]|uniref:Uncharacterized protein n=1 Tax=Falsibacillus pallidus TaxID=493781 RepID=A0A370GVL1_9BACI|nr:hypothetical protein [Falsibacillus pallidus]RDI47715.1 hypothetical protein DFR59_101377 [Falsibacillus pallidus]
MQDLNEVWESLRAEGMTVNVFCDLLMLKMWNDDFKKERQEIRMDFLVRGICEREVDGLLEDPGLYNKIYLRPVIRWESIMKAAEEGEGKIIEFIPLLKQIITVKFPVHNRTNQLEEWGQIPRKTLVNALNYLDHYSCAENHLAVEKFINEHWPA